MLKKVFALVLCYQESKAPGPVSGPSLCVLSWAALESVLCVAGVIVEKPTSLPSTPMLQNFP